MKLLKKVKGGIQDFLHTADLVLLALCITASCIGLVLIYSATRYQAKYHSLYLKQGFCILLGIAAFVVLSYVDLKMLVEKWRWLFAGSVCFILLLYTPLGADYGLGNRAWLDLKVINVQPAEVVKLVFVILLAYQFARLQQKDLNRVRSLVQPVFHLLFMVGLIFVVSGDAGSALVYVAIFAFMAWAAGVKLRWFLLGAAAIGVAGVTGYMLLDESNYWKQRIQVIFDHSLYPQTISFNQTRSLLAIRSGGLTGNGYLQGNLTQSSTAGALPERYGDFIFASCAEEWGLVGCIVVLLVLGSIVARVLYVGLTASSSFYGMVCVGYAGMMAFQIFVNVGMCLFIFPVIGLTLPFISNGGSSVIMLFAAMGLVSGIRRQMLPSWLRDRGEPKPAL